MQYLHSNTLYLSFFLIVSENFCDELFTSIKYINNLFKKSHHYDLHTVFKFRRTFWLESIHADNTSVYIKVIKGFGMTI